MTDATLGPAPKRRWFQFSLATLFVAVTVFSCWLAYQLNWIRERHQLLAHQTQVFQAAGEDFSAREVDSASLKKLYSTHSVRAPWPLWLFGEEGTVRVNVVRLDDHPGPFYSDHYEEYREAQRCFPEALDVVLYILPTKTTAVAPCQ
jgi:hypothetical protein